MAVVHIVGCDNCGASINRESDRWSHLRFESHVYFFAVDLCEACRNKLTIHQVIELILRMADGSSTLT